MLPIGRNLGDITPKSANLVVVVGEFSKTDVKSGGLVERLYSTYHIITVVSSNFLSFLAEKNQKQG